MGLRQRSFLARFWTLLNEEDEQADRLIGWSENGKIFYIFDTSRDREHLTKLAIERGVLQRAGHGRGKMVRKTPKYDNISRQLRYYGFNRKVELDRGCQIAWSHPHLNRDSTSAEVGRWKSNAPSKRMQQVKSKKTRGERCQERDEGRKEYDDDGEEERDQGSVFYDNIPQEVIDCVLADDIAGLAGGEMHRDSVHRGTTATSSPEHDTVKPMSVDSGIREQVEKPKITIYRASLVCFDKPLRLYDLENLEEDFARHSSDFANTTTMGQQALLTFDENARTQTPSPTLAPQMDWKMFDLEIEE